MRMHYTFDSELELKDAGLIAADAAWQVDAANKIIDVGAGLWSADIVIDVSAIEVDTGDELYALSLQVSSSATFASSIFEVACLRLGDAAALLGDTDSPTGRYVLPITNYYGGNTYRYVRGYTDVTGTLATGINFTAFAAKRH